MSGIVGGVHADPGNGRQSVHAVASTLRMDAMSWSG